MQETVRPDELALFREALNKAKIAEQEAEILQLRIFLKYGLRPGDGFAMDTGIITRGAAPAQEAPEQG